MNGWRRLACAASLTLGVAFAVPVVGVLTPAPSANAACTWVNVMGVGGGGGDCIDPGAIQQHGGIIADTCGGGGGGIGRIHGGGGGCRHVFSDGWIADCGGGGGGIGIFSGGGGGCGDPYPPPAP